MKRTATKGRISLTSVDVTHLPAEPLVVGRNDVEASSSGGKLSKKQRKKLNAKLRVQNLLSESPTMQRHVEPIAAVPAHNKFSNLRWVKRNSSKGELKQSFWEPPQNQAPTPQRRKPETISTRVYNVLKTVKERRLMKKKFQLAGARRAYTGRLSLPAKSNESLRQNSRDERQHLKFKSCIQRSVVGKAKVRAKQIWRPKSREEATNDKGKVVIPGSSPRKPTADKGRQEWIPKRGIHIEDSCDGRYPGESSRRSCHNQTPPLV